MNAQIRTVIIDDEPPARKMLRRLLDAHPEVELLGEAVDVGSGAELCNRERPDLVLLDIQLPRRDGFALLPLLDYAPRVVFVTAFDKYAVRAFEVNALDYLLKPIAPDRLATALSRAAAGLAAPDEKGGELADTDLVALREDAQLRMVPVRSVTHIQAEDNYSRVHLKEGAAALVRRTLGEWEELLPKETFLRVDRSMIVRIDAVREFRTITRDLSEVVFPGCAAPVEMGRRASRRLRNAVGM
ncbi:MAG: LytTR family DNA-binding domain-containing protein [Luteolibacter sp.]